MPTYGPALAVGDVIQITSFASAADQLGVNVLHYQVDVASTTPVNSLSSAVEIFLAHDWPTKLRACMSAAATYGGIISRVIHPTLSLPYPDTLGTGIGAVVGSLLPKQTAGFLRKRAAVAGKRLSGRIYIPFPAEEDSDGNGIPSDDYLARAFSLGIAYQSNLTWGDVGKASACIVRRARPTHIPPITFATRGIATVLPAKKWATQRRRGSFGRPNVSPF